VGGALHGERETLFVAELDGRVVALRHIALRQPISEHAPVALVDELVVAEGFRGRGIGFRDSPSATSRSVPAPTPPPRGSGSK